MTKFCGDTHEADRRGQVKTVSSARPSHQRLLLLTRRAPNTGLVFIFLILTFTSLVARLSGCYLATEEGALRGRHAGGVWGRGGGGRGWNWQLIRYKKSGDETDNSVGTKAELENKKDNWFGTRNWQLIRHKKATRCGVGGGGGEREKKTETNRQAYKDWETERLTTESAQMKILRWIFERNKLRAFAGRRLEANFVDLLFGVFSGYNSWGWVFDYSLYTVIVAELFAAKNGVCTSCCMTSSSSLDSDSDSDSFSVKFYNKGSVSKSALAYWLTAVPENNYYTPVCPICPLCCVGYIQQIIGDCVEKCNWTILIPLCGILK